MNNALSNCYKAYDYPLQVPLIIFKREKKIACKLELESFSNLESEQEGWFEHCGQVSFLPSTINWDKQVKCMEGKSQGYLCILVVAVCIHVSASFCLAHIVTRCAYAQGRVKRLSPSICVCVCVYVSAKTRLFAVLLLENRHEIALYRSASQFIFFERCLQSRTTLLSSAMAVESQPYFPIASGRGVAHFFDSFSP